MRRILGVGGGGVVYAASHMTLDIPVAVKVLRPDLAEDDEFYERFYAEARQIAKLEHPNIVRVYDVGEFSGRHYIIMSYVDGVPLHRHAVEHGLLPQPKAAEYLSQAISGLKAAHEAGILHRDIKPDNLLLGKDGTVKLVDFGIARIPSIDPQSRLTPSDRVPGTPPYLAPEVWSADAHVDERTDLFALGVSFYELLAGERPYPSSDFTELIRSIAEGQHETLDKRRPDLDPVFARFIEKLMATLPEERYQTAAEARTALESWRSGSATAISTQVFNIRRSNLPAPSGPMVGREEERLRLGDLLKEGPSRVVTLTGPGGIGKTRLAIEVARDLMTDFEGGAWFARLSDTRDAAGVAAAVAQALGIRLQDSDDPPKAVADALRYRPATLIVLDNFEQVAEHAEATVGAWRGATPEIRFLVTSRTLLGIEDEQQLELTTLPAPTRGARVSSATDIEGFESVALFVAKAQQVNPKFRLNDKNAGDVAELCTALDGLPLAIELAAARIRVMSPLQMVGKLEDRFALVRSTRKDLPKRHQTLRASFDWSYELLSPAERAVFLQLSHFKGGFTLDAAEAVVQLEKGEAVVDAVQALREHSFVQPTGGRFTMFDTLREYAQERWKRDAEKEKRTGLDRRFVEYFAQTLAALDDSIRTKNGIEALDRISHERDNVLTALGIALEYDPILAADLTIALQQTLTIRGPHTLRIPLIERVLERIGDDSSARRARLLIQLAEAHRARQNWKKAGQILAQAGKVASAAGASKEHVDAMILHALNCNATGAVKEGLKWAGKARETAEAVGDARLSADAALISAVLILSSGMMAEAQEMTERAAAEFKRMGDSYGLMRSLHLQGLVLMRTGKLDAAGLRMREAGALGRRLGHEDMVARSMTNRAAVLLEKGDYDRALALQRVAETLGRRAGNRLMMAVNIVNQGVVYRHRGDYSTAVARLVEAAGLHRELGNWGQLAIAMENLACVLRVAGQLEEAEERITESIRLHEKTNGTQTMLYWNALTEHARILKDLERHDEAVRVARHAAALQPKVLGPNSSEIKTVEENIRDIKAILASA